MAGRSAADGARVSIAVTDRYAVMGHPIGHSRSPAIHTLFARQTGQRLLYDALDVLPANFSDAARRFFAEGGRGLNVTLPHKEAAFALAERRTPRASSAAAVNTLTCVDGHILGDNTDGAGLVRDLCGNLGVELAAQRLLLLGAGGAARGVIAPLLAAAPAALVIANRRLERASELAHAQADERVLASGLEALRGRQFDVVINATSASLADQVPAVPAGVIGARSCCYDMAYGKGPTAFMRWASGQGAIRVFDGLGMLVEQAAESFYLWRGVRPETAPIMAALKSLQ
jgi:shikimate dehydrogenase